MHSTVELRLQRKGLEGDKIIETQNKLEDEIIEIKTKLKSTYNVNSISSMNPLTAQILQLSQKIP